MENKGIGKRTKYRKHEVIYFEGEEMKYIDYYMYSIFDIKMREVNNHKNFIETLLNVKLYEKNNNNKNFDIKQWMKTIKQLQRHC